MNWMSLGCEEISWETNVGETFGLNAPFLED